MHLLKSKKRPKTHRLSPAYMVFMWFGFATILGSVLLWLPISHTSAEVKLDFVAALFTAVSAVCVTGLSVVNVHDTFSFFGQFVIFALMELGGMGIMTFASLGFRLFGRRIPLEQQVATADAIYQNDAASEFRRTFAQILRVTLSIQAIGAVLMVLALIPRHWQFPHERPFMVWSAIFHSASAFCNSGFTLYQDDLLSHLDNLPFLILILTLVTLGGIGFMVLNELYRLPGYIRNHSKKPKWISLHTRVALSVTAGIITLGTIVFWVLGTDGKTYSVWEAIFETISGRTAGFSIVQQQHLPLPSALFICLIMFIGGSPGSCAGGIKTTSLAIWIARIQANLRNDHNVNLFGYTIAPDLVSRARILMAITMIWLTIGVFILAIIHPDVSLEVLMFEQVSAFGTVGLTMNFTPNLTTASRLWIMLSMFVGRLGPLSIALWMVPATRVSINRPMGRIMVG